MQHDAQKRTKYCRFQSAGRLSGIVLSGIFLSLSAFAKDIVTNNVMMSNAPDWLKQPRVEKVSERIERRLKPNGSKTQVTWLRTDEEYDKAVPYGKASLAVTKYEGGVPSVIIGPQVDDKNFDEVFGHELVHVTLYQKFKGAVPKWLEEGVANFLSSKTKVDYKWLASQEFPDDVTTLAHPFSGAPALISYRYKASQALCEMLERKCQSLEGLIAKSADPKKKMEDYIKTMCEISDLNAAFKEWVKKKAVASSATASSK